MTQPVLVTVARGDEIPAALATLWSHLPAEERPAQAAAALSAAHAGNISLEGLLQARRGADVVGALLIIVKEDRTAFVWPPSPALPEEISAALLEAACEWLSATPVRLAQCLVDATEEETSRRLAAHGFPYLTDLEILICLPTMPLEDVPAGLEMVEYSAAAHDRFARVLERTYIGSLDCPQLSGLRPPDEALSGYRSAGQFDPRHWWILTDRTTDLGLLLLAQHSQEALWEVLYLGVVAEARGRGFGRVLLTHGLNTLRDRGGQGMFLGVDSANTYAIKLYSDFGFYASATKRVHLRTWLRGAGE